MHVPLCPNDVEFELPQIARVSVVFKIGKKGKGTRDPKLCHHAAKSHPQLVYIPVIIRFYFISIALSRVTRRHYNVCVEVKEKSAKEAG